MEMMRAGFLLLLICSAYSYQLSNGAGLSPSVLDPDAEWERMVEMIDKETSASSVPAVWRSSPGSGSSIHNLPLYKRISVSKYPKEAFKPALGVEPLPEWAKEILLVPSTYSAPATYPPGGATLEVLCYIDKICVRILREYFKSRYAANDLKLGTCPVNYRSDLYFYFNYHLTVDCGYHRQSEPDYLSYSNTLSYKPSGEVLREMPFDIPIQCQYSRLFHSYKVGFHPKMQVGTVWKSLSPKTGVVLAAQDASGNDYAGTKTYILGQPMFFEARKADTASYVDQRLYINKCFMTANPSSDSIPKYTVIDNQGCMVDGLLASHSKFLSSPSKGSQRFQVEAFIFKDQVSLSSTSEQLYMHCEVVIGQLTPSPSSKACSYNIATKEWKELYGHDSVCACCDFICPSIQPRASRKTISTATWKVSLSEKDDQLDMEALKSANPDLFNIDDSNMAEYVDFLNHWEDDDQN